MRRRSVIATVAAALAGAAVLAGASFAVQLSLARPPSPTRRAATIEKHVRELRVVYSAGVLAGRRIASVCRTTENQRYSLIEFGGGGRGLASWRTGRMFHRRTRQLGPLGYEILLAGCSAQMQRLLAQEIRLAYESGRPLRIAPAIFRGESVLRVRLSKKPRLLYMFVDRERLVPVGLALRTPEVSGTTALEAQEPLGLRGHRLGLH